MISGDIIKLTDKYIAPTYARYGAELVRGEGSLLFDSGGKRYIDLGSGIAVNTFGAADKDWISAVGAQLQMLGHTSNLYYTAPQAELAAMLCEKTGMKRVFFSNSGAEANECAIKAARKYSNDKYGAGRHTIITLNGSFHGRTVTTLAATGQDSFHHDFAPFTEGFVHIEAGDLTALEKELQKGAAAFMVELIQGESGVKVLNQNFVKDAMKLCEKYDTLFIDDEVQTGNGRTGKLYCYENYGIIPDIITTAKGLGGGLPIGATMFGDKTALTLGAGKHGSTFGGNPICSAGALSVLKRLDDKLLEEVKQKGEYIKSELSGCKGVKSFSGMGLMIGIEVYGQAKDIAGECLKKGVLVLTAKDKVRLLPPLNIPEKLLKEALCILKDAIISSETKGE